MAIFQTAGDQHFQQAEWEQRPAQSADSKTAEKGFLESHAGETDFFERRTDDTDVDANQFILLQLSDGDQRVLSTSKVTPKLAGASATPDINMRLDFEGFKIGSAESIDRDTKATLQLRVGQEQKMDGLDKLFYCINGGLDLYNELKKKASDSRDFKKSTGEAFGNKPISLPGGTGEISLQVIKHEEPAWWQRIFAFAKSDAAQEVMSLIGFAGVTKAAIDSVSGMLDKLFDKSPEVLFQSIPIKLAFTQSAKDELGGGLSTNYVSCLNEGFWVMARKSDYDTILGQKPIYYSGLGVLAPDGMSEIDAVRDSSNNPFSAMSYAIIRARMKEVDLKAGLL